MTGEILKALMDEEAALFAGTPGTFILKTDFKNEKLSEYAMPLVLMDLLDGPDSKMYPTGMTQMEWNLAFNSYNYMPDPTNDDQTNYSATLINDPIDTIRVHFSANYGPYVNTNTPYLEGTGWLTQGMADIFNNYGFQFTLSGVTTADALNQDGLIMGYKINFYSTAFDNTTLRVRPSEVPLMQINQVMNTSLLTNFLLNADGVMNVPANTLIQNIYLDEFNDTTPTIGIGITPFGYEILEPTAISNFLQIKADMYFETPGILYFTVSGGWVSGRITWLTPVFA